MIYVVYCSAKPMQGVHSAQDTSNALQTPKQKYPPGIPLMHVKSPTMRCERQGPEDTSSAQAILPAVVIIPEKLFRDNLSSPHYPHTLTLTFNP